MQRTRSNCVIRAVLDDVIVGSLEAVSADTCASKVNCCDASCISIFANIRCISNNIGNSQLALINPLCTNQALASYSAHRCNRIGSPCGIRSLAIDLRPCNAVVQWTLVNGVIRYIGNFVVVNIKSTGIFISNSVQTSNGVRRISFAGPILVIISYIIILSNTIDDTCIIILFTILCSTLIY